VGPRVVKSPPEVARWVTSSFTALGCVPPCIASEHLGKGAELSMDVDLLKAWTRNVNSSVATSLVFKVRYLRSNTLLKEQTYRGSDLSSNWANGEGETQSHFDASMQQVLDQVRQDLIALCEVNPGTI